MDALNAHLELFMPFNSLEVARQIERSRSGVQAQRDERARAIQHACRVYRSADETGWEQRVQTAEVRRWVAVPATSLSLTPRYEPAEPNYTMAATDSSYIQPDKHRGAFCYLINVGRVMLRYGEDVAAEIDNIPNHYAELPIESEEEVSNRALGARCALRELQELYEWARCYEADVALADGSLMQLIHVLSKEAQVQELMHEYFQTLRAFQEIGVPIVGYISQPASQMVMRAVRMLACDQPVPHERRPHQECGCRDLWSIDDGDLMWHLVEAGQRTPIFEPVFSHLVGSNVQDFKSLVFCYLGTEHEIVRLEFPVWVSEQGLLDHAIAAILHQCKLGRGYPNALTLAHQYAALHNSDRENYYFLLERAGLMNKPTEKAHGKRLVGQAI